jgi:hypothetical protein
MNTEYIDTKIEAARIAGGAALFTVYGITLSEWAAIATIIYMAAQTIILAPRVWKTLKNIRKWGSE